jgi:transcription termination factor Rho
LIVDEKELQKMWILRKILHPMETVEAAEFLIDRLKPKCNSILPVPLNS